MVHKIFKHEWELVWNEWVQILCGRRGSRLWFWQQVHDSEIQTSASLKTLTLNFKSSSSFLLLRWGSLRSGQSVDCSTAFLWQVLYLVYRFCTFYLFRNQNLAVTSFVVATEFSVFCVYVCVCVASSCVWSPSFFFFADSEGKTFYWITNKTCDSTVFLFFFRCHSS